MTGWTEVSSAGFFMRCGCHAHALLGMMGRLLSYGVKDMFTLRDEHGTPTPVVKA